jgi:hypothetical protein
VFQCERVLFEPITALQMSAGEGDLSLLKHDVQFRVEPQFVRCNGKQVLQQPAEQNLRQAHLGVARRYVALGEQGREKGIGVKAAVLR